MDNENKPKKISPKALVAILLVAVLLVGFAFGYFCYYLRNREYNKYIEILKLVEKYGIDATTNDFGEELSQDEIAEILVNGLLEKDDYKEYFSEEEYKQLLKEKQGKFTGIGVSLGVYVDGETNQIIEDRVVARVVGNSPAMKAGFKVGDIIVQGKRQGVDYQELNSQEDILQFIDQSSDNQTLTFKVDRQGKSVEIDVVKQEYVASYVTYASNTEKIVFGASTKDNYKLEGESISNLKDDTAYILLDEFNGDASSQFANALEYAFAKGKSKIIFDLRNNGGGKMDVMLDIASHLIYNNGAKSSPIAVTKYKPYKERERQEIYSTSKNNYKKDKIDKIVVLANHNTASASECIINAMLYYGKESNDNNFTAENNLVVSKYNGVAKTYGKGIMQTTFELRNGGALKLTTAKIYAPDGSNCIHGVGFSTSEDNSVGNANALARAIQLLEN